MNELTAERGEAGGWVIRRGRRIVGRLRTSTEEAGRVAQAIVGDESGTLYRGIARAATAAARLDEAAMEIQSALRIDDRSERHARIIGILSRFWTRRIAAAPGGGRETEFAVTMLQAAPGARPLNANAECSGK